MPSPFARAAAAGLLALLPMAATAQQDPAGLAQPNTARVQDALRLLPPRATTTGGLLGDRYEKNAIVRLLNVDEKELLEGFRHKPGKQAWIGEHVGKFLHAASLAYAGTGDPRLKEKITRVATELIKTQEPDGYLGTYTPETRFGQFPNADWDVWVHKYDLLGLLTYYQYTGDKSSLAACRKVGDLLINTFGPGKKSILSAGTHMGMAATSVLEPMVLLYRATADPRYLDFAKYIVAAWDEPNGPKVETTLLTEKSVRKTANGKAYEMLSNLNGLCELYRVTGERPYLEAVQNAWDDVVKHRLYITGSGSAGEHWQDDYHLPNGNNASICETCVTVTWEQLNLQLLRLTGESRYADQLERSVYNHLLGAQKPGGDQWCYYTPLQGTKPYGNSTNCCLSSGPRGVALLPTFVYATDTDGITVNLYTESHAAIDVAGKQVKVSQRTDYPTGNVVTIRIDSAPESRFGLQLRIPAWSTQTQVRVNGDPIAITPRSGAYVRLLRSWKSGDQVQLTFDMSPRLVLGDHENAGKATVTVGPIVLAADEGHNPAYKPIGRCEIAGSGEDVSQFHVAAEAARDKDGAPVYDVTTAGADQPLRLVPFYAAGADGSPFAVWLNRPGQKRAAGASLLSFADETQSAFGNQIGSITDDDPATFVVTFNGEKQKEAWFAATPPKPAEISRVVYCHGRSFHDGGWFDTSVTKPRIQIRRSENGKWEDIAMLAAYPDSTATKPGAGLRDGAAFEVKFPAVMAYAVRVIGTPANGDNPSQSFASCAELRAFK